MVSLRLFRLCCGAGDCLAHAGEACLMSAQLPAGSRRSSIVVMSTDELRRGALASTRPSIPLVATRRISISLVDHLFVEGAAHGLKSAGEVRCTHSIAVRSSPQEWLR